MPPNTVVATTTGSLSEPAIKYNEDDVFTWEQVYHYVSTNQIKNIHRNKQVQTVYDAWMKDTLANYGTIEKYLLTTKLKFEAMTDPNCPPVIILPNDFPYSVTPGIHHILLWSQIPLTRLYIQHILDTKYAEFECVYFVNPPEIQSVRKLPHVHVFMRRRF